MGEGLVLALLPMLMEGEDEEVGEIAERVADSAQSEGTLQRPRTHPLE